MTSNNNSSSFEDVIIHQFKIGAQINQGCTATIYKAVHVETRVPCCVKIIHKSEDMNHHIINEINILRKIKHHNIVEFISAVETKKYYFIFLEFLEGDTLKNEIVKNGKLEDHQAKKIFKQMMKALNYIHKHHICHRDIKPENIMITRSNVVKIIDFGFACECRDLISNYCGTLNFCCPECLNEVPYSGSKFDMWSSGVVLYVMIAGQLPFNHANSEIKVEQICQGNYMIPNDILHHPASIIQSLLVVNPMVRLSAEKVLEHAWFYEENQMNQEHQNRNFGHTQSVNFFRPFNQGVHTPKSKIHPPPPVNYQSGIRPPTILTKKMLEQGPQIQLLNFPIKTMTRTKSHDKNKLPPISLTRKSRGSLAEDYSGRIGILDNF